mmetsp:Transcript_30096/g.73258  ORF Transcript_30096/g.73258 Transcript_30096/m.73258 type:complete len:279 (+) Transcript_30096:133-969(+)|eukprot:CAMPEP_0114487922 /NCGR_PEP_ID=MMETSP0109-20121206/1039_1 /TAXON_ID=29199 /ORGANISM="Chlorarachnion reptans, Strain CCCM449" /LENGTH=278 /DNA_ID=CAMNT_0001664249 /DNA_START=52 /DNA_END=888 /DNA_ORIENTATION=-
MEHMQLKAVVARTRSQRRRVRLCLVTVAMMAFVAMFASVMSPTVVSAGLRVHGTQQPMPLTPFLPRRAAITRTVPRDSLEVLRMTTTERRSVSMDATKKEKAWGKMRHAARANPQSKWIPKTEEMDFQVIGDREKFSHEELLQFIHDWFIKYPNSELHVGADSKKRGGTTSYVCGICLYHKGYGGTVLYHRKLVPSAGSNLERLWIELEIAMEVSNFIRKNTNDELPISVHIDYNPQPMYKVSNALYSSGMAWIKSAGFNAIAKPDAWAASSVADKLT